MDSNALRSICTCLSLSNLRCMALDFLAAAVAEETAGITGADTSG